MWLEIAPLLIQMSNVFAEIVLPFCAADAATNRARTNAEDLMSATAFLANWLMHLGS